VDDLQKLLTNVRAHYVDMFENALKELREKGHRLIIEPPMVDEAGDLAREGVLNVGSRYDLAIEENGAATPSMFQPSKMLKFEPAAFHGGLNIVVSPFQWMMCASPPMECRTVAAVLAGGSRTICAPEAMLRTAAARSASSRILWWRARPRSCRPILEPWMSTS
jgi:hypothetical protein